MHSVTQNFGYIKSSLFLTYGSLGLGSVGVLHFFKFHLELLVLPLQHHLAVLHLLGIAAFSSKLGCELLDADLVLPGTLHQHLALRLLHFQSLYYRLSQVSFSN